jgi:ATP-dependent Clp protease ATP-binding subunit ClpA
LLAQEKQHGQIETGHFLVALLEKDEQVTPFLLKKVGANPPLY